MRWLLGVLCVAACGDDGASSPDAALPVDGFNEPQTVELERAAPPAQPGFALHAGDGQLWVRGRRGLFSSSDAGVTWNQLYQGPTAEFDVATDGSVVAARLEGTTLVVDRFDAGTPTRLDVPASFPAPGQLTAYTFALAGQQLYASAQGTLDPATVAPAQLFISSNRGESFTPLAPPAGAEASFAWTLEACGDLLVASGTVGGTYVWRGTAWEELFATVGYGACLPDGALLGVTVEGATTRVSRFRWTGDMRTDTTTVIPAVAEVVVTGSNVTGVAGARLFESSDGGATFAERAITPPKSIAQFPGLVATTQGVWMLDGSFPSLLPPGASTWRLAGLPGVGELSYAIDTGELGSTRFLLVYQDPYDGGVGAHFLLGSDDEGATWHHLRDVPAGPTCMAVDPVGIFLGGAGDVRGASWAVLDATGLVIVKEGRVLPGDDPSAHDQTIVACDWNSQGAQSSIFVAQTAEETVSNSRIRFYSPFSSNSRWDILPYYPDSAFRITALDHQTEPRTYIRTAFEDLVQGAELRAYRGFYYGEQEYTEEVDRNALVLGARAAVMLDDDIALYPDSRVIINFQQATLVGLPSQTVIKSARADANRTLWLATTTGLYRSKAPIQ